MTEPNEPDKKDEAAETTEDEAVIDLNDEVEAASKDDEEPIDLTEAVEESPAKDQSNPPEAEANATTADEASNAPEEALKGDEEIIDLLQAVEEPSVEDSDKTISEGVTADSDDEIIDLLDAAEETPITEDTEKSVAEDTETAEDEAIIDLIEPVDDTALELDIEDIGEPIAESADFGQEFEDISDLDSDLIKEATGSMDGSDSDTIVNDALKPDFTDSLGIELGSEEDAKGNLFDPDKVSNEQIDAALERVVKKMFYEKIDRLLVEAIEKTVKKEIEKLKKALLDDATGGE